MRLLPATHAAIAALLSLSAAASVAHDGALNVQFARCSEFVGVVPVDAAAARALVPARYHLVADAAGARLVVRAADCESVRVGPLPARPGRVAQVGIMIVSPDGTAADPNTGINNYTLSYASNSAALVLALRAAGVPAALDAGLAYEVTPAAAGELYVAVGPELDAGSPTWFLQGQVTTPAIHSRFDANWWRQAGAREVKMATSIDDIAFDFGSAVTFSTSRHNLIGRLLGRNHVAGFPLSFRGRFDAGSMQVTSSRP